MMKKEKDEHCRNCRYLVNADESFRGLGYCEYEWDWKPLGSHCRDWEEKEKEDE